MANVGYDKEDPKPLLIGLAVVVILLFTFISGWVLKVYFDLQARDVYTRTVLQAPHEQLNALRAEADVRLHKYGWVDKNAGVAHMPIEEAMKLAIADLKTPAAAPAPVKAPAPAPTPAKAPAKK